MRPEKIQISLCIRAVWSESVLGTFWIAKYAKFLDTDNGNSNKTARIRRLIWTFVGRTCQTVLFSRCGSTINGWKMSDRERWNRTVLFISYRFVKVILFVFTAWHTVLSVDFKLSRHLGYFLINVYIPCCLLVILSWVAFWINREATADRIALGKIYCCIYPNYFDTFTPYHTCPKILPNPFSSRKHVFVMLTPLNPTFV